MHGLLLEIHRYHGPRGLPYLEATGPELTMRCISWHAIMRQCCAGGVQVSNTLTSMQILAPCSPVLQEEMKLCLLLSVIDPRLGGVMVMGEQAAPRHGHLG